MTTDSGVVSHKSSRALAPVHRRRSGRRTNRPNVFKSTPSALIDAGERPGLKNYEADPLLAARRRVKELEAELKAVKAASALFEEDAVDPKGSSRLSEG